MSTTVLPELAAESVETAERLVRLSAGKGLDPAEAQYIFASGLAAIERVLDLWPIIRARIGRGTTGPAAYELLTQFLVVVDKNLPLAESLKEPAHVARTKLEREPDRAAGLATAQAQLRLIRAEAERLLKVVEAPALWPEEELREAKEQIGKGHMLTADEFRQALLRE